MTTGCSTATWLTYADCAGAESWSAAVKALAHCGHIHEVRSWRLLICCRPNFGTIQDHRVRDVCTALHESMNALTLTSLRRGPLQRWCHQREPCLHLLPAHTVAATESGLCPLLVEHHAAGDTRILMTSGNTLLLQGSIWSTTAHYRTVDVHPLWPHPEAHRKACKGTHLSQDSRMAAGAGEDAERMGCHLQCKACWQSRTYCELD